MDEEERKLEEAKHLITSSFQSAHSYDKTILTIATGAFGLSFLFIKDVIAFLNKNTLWMLMISWILFSLSILAILVSFQTSQAACNFQMRYLYKICEQKNEWGIATRILNIISIICLIFAIFFMGAFFYINLLYHVGSGK